MGNRDGDVVSDDWTRQQALDLFDVLMDEGYPVDLSGSWHPRHQIEQWSVAIGHLDKESLRDLIVILDAHGADLRSSILGRGGLSVIPADPMRDAMRHPVRAKPRRAPT